MSTTPATSKALQWFWYLFSSLYATAQWIRTMVAPGTLFLFVTTGSNCKLEHMAWSGGVLASGEPDATHQGVGDRYWILMVLLCVTSSWNVPKLLPASHSDTQGINLTPHSYNFMEITSLLRPHLQAQSHWELEHQSLVWGKGVSHSVPNSDLMRQSLSLPVFSLSKSWSSKPTPACPPFLTTEWEKKWFGVTKPYANVISCSSRGWSQNIWQKQLKGVYLCTVWE